MIPEVSPGTGRLAAVLQVFHVLKINFGNGQTENRDYCSAHTYKNVAKKPFSNLFLFFFGLGKMGK